MKRIVKTDGAPAALGPYSQGVGAGKFLYTAGQIPIDPQTGEQEKTDIRKAAHRCLANIKAILEAGGAGMDDIIKCTVFMLDISDFPAVNEVYASFFGAEPPARSCVQVAGLPGGAVLEIEAVAYVE